MMGPKSRVKAFSPRVATRSRPLPGIARTVAARGAELIKASSVKLGEGESELCNSRTRERKRLTSKVIPFTQNTEYILFD